MAKSEDHLDSEVSIKAQITETGVELKAKSRLVSGFDRLGGNLSELINAPMERRNARIRGEIRVIEAATEVRVEEIRSSSGPEGAPEIKVIQSNSRRLTNQAEAVVIALEDLSARPPTDEQQSTGPDKLSDEFLDRWERYAEDASSEELRWKWGKVLAAEIREPGRISRRTMRTVDELPTAIALKFEELCGHRLGPHLISGLTGKLDLETTSSLSFYGLLVDPGMTGHISTFTPIETNSGAALWMYVAGKRALGLSRDRTGLWIPTNELLQDSGEGGPAIPVYLLTDAGREIASIFNDRNDEAWTVLITALIAMGGKSGGGTIWDFRLHDGQFRPVAKYEAAAE